MPMVVLIDDAKRWTQKIHIYKSRFRSADQSRLGEFRGVIIQIEKLDRVISHFIPQFVDGSFSRGL